MDEEVRKRKKDNYNISSNMILLDRGCLSNAVRLISVFIVIDVEHRDKLDVI